MPINIDVVIPSFRLEENNLLPVFSMRKPDFANVCSYLILDNPQAVVPVSIRKLANDKQIVLLINEANRGASFTRNRGIDAGTGEWILFLDDDLSVPDNLLEIYASAIEKYPSEIGFIGLVRLPEPQTDFAKAVQISGAMDIFSVAERKPSFVWGATANFMLRRSALNQERFSLLYPKSGGGEDVDFFLKVREKNGYQNYRSLPQAAVYHPWWNSGRKDFRKSFRYGLGNSWLGQLNPAYTYYDFLNLPELLLLCVPSWIILVLIKPTASAFMLLFIVGILLIECIASFIQTYKRGSDINLRIAWYVLAQRMVYESGLLWGNLGRGRLIGIGERFHDDGKKNKFFFYRSNTRRIVKWILYPVLIYFLIRYF
jgi:GT2 family glycosyltransferase